MEYKNVLLFTVMKFNNRLIRKICGIEENSHHECIFSQ